MYLPINIQMDGRRCVVVGGSTVAARKCTKLAGCGAVVTAIAPVFSDDPVWNSGQVELVRDVYRTGCLGKAFLVIAATDDPLLNETILGDARQNDMLAQRVDQSDAGDFFLPATHACGPLTVSFATDGVNPAFSRALKKRAGADYDEAYGECCRLMEQVRNLPEWQVMERNQRGRALKGMADCSEKVIGHIRRGRTERAYDCLLETAFGPGRPGSSVPLVYLVGAGPGDLGLLTIKGAQALRMADVVLYDGFANPLLLEQYCRQDAELIDVGKHKGNHRKTQEEINALLIEKAVGNRVVVRLKGGDPILFGRGGEEARVLASHGISFEIVPGVTSALAVPIYAGIPVTDREYASSVGFYSLHRKEGSAFTEMDWERMAKGPDTLVLLMGSTVLADIVRQLVRYGRPETTPVALITRGTNPGQKRYLATLATIMPLVAGRQIERPAIIVVGDVVRAAATMDWFACETITEQL